MADENNNAVYQIVDRIIQQDTENPGHYHIQFAQFPDDDSSEVQNIKQWLSGHITLPTLIEPYIENDETFISTTATESGQEEKILNGAFKDIAFTAQYSDLIGAPALPATAAYIYTTNENNEEVIEGVKPFNPIAFTGLTGENVNIDWNNANIGYTLNLTDFDTGSNSTFRNIDIPQSQEIVDGNEATITLTRANSVNYVNKILNARNTYTESQGRNVFIKTGNNRYIVSSIIPVADAEDPGMIAQLQFITMPTGDFTYNPNAEGTNELNKMTLNYKQYVFIFDVMTSGDSSNEYYNVYCKIKNTFDYETEISGGPTAESVLSQISYSSLEGAPRVPSQEDMPKIYDIVSNEETGEEPEQGSEEETTIYELKPLSAVAFTGDYNDLINTLELPDNDKAYNMNGDVRESIKPLDVIAFTGDYEDLDNKPISAINLLSFANYNYEESGLSNEQKLMRKSQLINIDNTDFYVTDMDKYSGLQSAFMTFVSNFRNGANSQIRMSNIYLVTNIAQAYHTVSGTSYSYYIFDLTPLYNNIVDLDNNAAFWSDSASTIASTLNNSSTSFTTTFAQLIYDTEHQNLFFRKKTI